MIELIVIGVVALLVVAVIWLSGVVSNLRVEVERVANAERYQNQAADDLNVKYWAVHHSLESLARKLGYERVEVYQHTDWEKEES